MSKTKWLTRQQIIALDLKLKERRTITPLAILTLLKTQFGGKKKRGGGRTGEPVRQKRKPPEQNTG